MKRALFENEDEVPLTTWELRQLVRIRGVRERLAQELSEIHRCGSLVDAFASFTDLLTQILAYAWRSTNALMRTCKRFHMIVHSRAYWTALALHAFAKQVPHAVLSNVNWFHGLADNDLPYSYLWSCVLSPKSKGYGLPKWATEQPSTLLLTHFRADELTGTFRRVLRLRWHPKDDGDGWWWSLSIFIIPADGQKTIFADFYSHAAHFTSVYVTYFGHPRLRRRLFVTMQDHLMASPNIEEDDPGLVVYCYNEVWDPVSERTWHGECPLVIRDIEDEAGYASWNPDAIGSWGTWTSSSSSHV